MAVTAQAQKPKIPLAARIKAWWDGYELALVERDQPVPDVEVPGHEVRADQHEWGSQRVRLVQDVWGQGFSSPGNEDYIVEMVKPFGLTPAMSVVEIGAGLGGACRVISEKFGVWITGFESVKEFADAGMELSTMAGVAKKAPVVPFDPDNFEHREKSVDCVFSKEALFTVKDKTKMMNIIAEALKDQGQLLFTDFVKAPDADGSEALASWIKSEPVEPHPWSVQDYEMALSRKKLEIRITEDISDPFRAMVMKGWSDYLAAAAQQGIDEQMAATVVSEVELWARRVKALESGALRVCRIYAMKKAGNLLSDW